MPIIGHQINKITAKRGDAEKNIKVESNIRLTNVEKKQIFAAGEKKSALDFSFEFTIKYGKKAGGLVINGVLYFTGNEKEMDKIEKKWKKDKKLEPNMVVGVLNRAMTLGYMQAVPLAERLRLPAPLKFPRFEKKKDKK